MVVYSPKAIQKPSSRPPLRMSLEESAFFRKGENAAAATVNLFRQPPSIRKSCTQVDQWEGRKSHRGVSMTRLQGHHRGVSSFSAGATGSPRAELQMHKSSVKQLPFLRPTLRIWRHDNSMSCFVAPILQHSGPSQRTVKGRTVSDPPTFHDQYKSLEL